MSRIRVFAAGMLVAVVAVLASAAPASAHGQLVSSSPAAGERLTAAPEQVSLTFTDELLTLDGAGMTVLVIDVDGRDWVEGEPTVSGPTVTAQLAAGMPVAGYELRWQVVSSDGHPISGVIPFTVGDAEPLTSVSEPPLASGDGDGDVRTQEQIQEQSAQESQPAIRLVLIGVGGAAIAVAVFALIQLLRRRSAAAPTTPRHDRGGREPL